MDKAKGEAINKLIAGQVKMEKDISVLKDGQVRMEKDISGIKVEMSGMKKDIFGLKTDVSDLKQGQSNLESMMLKMMEEMTFVKKIVMNIENTFKPQVKTLFDADKVRQHDTTDLKHICREQEERLEDHEIRISRLEKD